MHWAVPCISNLAKWESEAAPKSRRLQMMARVWLDASHVSRSVTAKREKVARYIRVPQRTSEVRAFRLSYLRLRVSRVYCEREHCTAPWEFLSVVPSIWWFGHWLGRWSAIGRSGATPFFCRFLRWILAEDGGWIGAHVDPTLTRQAPTFWSTGRIIRRPPWGRVKPVPIHSVSSWRFLYFSAWLCAGATIARCSFEFCSVISRFPPFVWVFVRWSEVFC